MICIGYQNFGGVTFKYQFDTNTSKADPGSGELRFNNANISSANRLYIDDNTNENQPLAANQIDDTFRIYFSATYMTDS